MSESLQPKGHLMGFSSLADILKDYVPEGLEEAAGPDLKNDQPEFQEVASDVGNIAIACGTDFGGACLPDGIEAIPNAVIELNEYWRD